MRHTERERERDIEPWKMYSRMFIAADFFSHWQQKQQQQHERKTHSIFFTEFFHRFNPSLFFFLSTLRLASIMFLVFLFQTITFEIELIAHVLKN